MLLKILLITKYITSKKLKFTSVYADENSVGFFFFFQCIVLLISSIHTLNAKFRYVSNHCVSVALRIVFIYITHRSPHFQYVIPLLVHSCNHSVGKPVSRIFYSVVGHFFTLKKKLKKNIAVLCSVFKNRKNNTRGRTGNVQIPIITSP